jgi:hypothetical protein
MNNTRIPLDSPSDNPALGFAEINLALKEVIEQSKTQFVSASSARGAPARPH